jgi:hemoglobin
MINLKLGTTMNTFKISIPLALLFLALALGGCGSQTARDRDFSTSGSREADQRADQRMAKSEQLKGDGTGAGEKKQQEAKRALYDRLGSEKGIQAIVDDFVPRALADPRVNWERKGVTRGGFSIHRNESVEWKPTEENQKNLKLHIAQFLSLATGGPTKYEGKEMKESHGGMHIANAEFDAAVGDLKSSLDKLQIPNQEQKELLAIIETTRPQVVEER